MHQETERTPRETRMLTEPLPQLICRMAAPTIVAFLINSIYGLADTYFVSSLGTNATAAVSVNASLDQLIMMAGSMLAVGANSYISRLLGAKNPEKACATLSTSFFTAAGFGTILAVGGLTFITPMVRLLGATATCERYAIDYATYILLAAPFMACNFVMNQCLRAEGSAMLSMIGMGFGGILNCVLDPIFIFYFDLGVAGASIATAISKVVSFAILFFPYITHRSLLRIHIKRVCYSRDIVTQVVTVGSSSMFRSGLAIVAAIVLNKLAGTISDSVLAAVGVSTKVMMFPFGVILGFCSGFQPVAGFSWGAKRYDRVKGSYRFSARISLAVSATMGLLIALFADQLILLFAEADPMMQRYGALCIRTQCLALPVHAWVAVVNMFCAGLGFAKGALLLSTSRQGSCFLPVVYPLAYFLGATGVCITQGVADVLTLVLAIPMLAFVFRRINALESAAAAETP